MNTIPNPFGATPRLVLTRVWCAAIVAIGASTACAEPLNALDFTSLGNKTFVAGAHTIFTDTAVINGPSGIMNGTVVGSRFVVFSFGNCTAPSTTTFSILGSTSRTVVFLASGDMDMAATFSFAGSNGNNFSGGNPGPGGGTGATPADKFSSGFGVAGGVGGNNAGGNGGSFGGAGGTGGGNVGSQPGAYGNLAIWLDAGSGGASGDSVNDLLSGATNYGGGGGGGGGTLELGALGTLTFSSGVLNAKGGNGSAGPNDSGNMAGGQGGGGGSGGGLYLHGATVVLGGAINCNGGNGGNGGTSSSAKGGSGGGGGAGGRVFIQSTSAPTLTGINVSGGTAGTAGTGSLNGTAGHNGGAGSTTNVAATLTTTTLDFGTVTVGTSKTLGMVIGCTGAANTAINGRFPAATAPFARVGTGIFSNLSQGRKTTNEYTFTPTHAGPYQQTLTFLSDGGNATVIIKGYGDCRSDLNQDLMVDDADFVAFAADYEALLCP